MLNDGSLMQCIIARRGSPTKGTAAQASTVGMKLHPHQLQITDVEVFDCPGQVDYAGMHQTFLTRRALYLLVVDITKYLDVEDLDKVGGRQLGGCVYISVTCPARIFPWMMSYALYWSPSQVPLQAFQIHLLFS